MGLGTADGPSAGLSGGTSGEDDILALGVVEASGGVSLLGLSPDS